MDKLSLQKRIEQLQSENDEMRSRLNEAEETLTAIRNGEIDAIVVAGAEGEKIYSLTSSETPYRIIIQEMNEGAVTLNSDGTILYSNQRFAELMKEPLRNVMGCSFKKFIAESDFENFDAILAQGLSKRSVGIVKSFHNNSKETLFLQLSLSPLPSDLPGNVIIIASNITELKHKEKELQDYQNSLEEIVAERTSSLADTIADLKASRLDVLNKMNEAEEAKNNLEISNTKLNNEIAEHQITEVALLKAKEKAEESDCLKSAFLANMSHEIRTPMNGILGFANLLKEPGLTGEEQQEYIAIIEKSGQRLLNIINDIIDISKIEASLMELRMSESNIYEHMDYIHTFFKPEAEAKGLKFLIKNALVQNEATLVTDSEKLYAILTNLVKNAIKYTHAGEIELGCARKSGVLEIYVKDTGIGIPKDRQQAIFERFIQADIEDKMAYQGAGLGLAITKAYVEMLGGKIWVESEEGKGSTFYFSMLSNSLPEKESAELEHEFADFKVDIRELKILVVEDDLISEKLFYKTLKLFTKELLKARTGIEAVKACRNNPDIDLILIDIGLPEMDGYEATKQIREFNKEVIIIAQTAYALTGDREKAIASGCNDYITKPVSKKELNGLIKKYFG